MNALRPNRLQLAVATASLIGLSIVFAWPFAWMASTSLKVPETVQSAPTELIPRADFLRQAGQLVRVRPVGARAGKLDVQILSGPHLDQTMAIDPGHLIRRPFLDVANYGDGLRAFPFFRYLWNTVVIAVIAVVGTVFSSSLVAYGLACVQWRGRESLFWMMLATMMLPGQVTMIPLFLTFKTLGWIDTILPLTVPAFFGSAAFIFLLRQFYRSIPRDLLEAARLDGASDLRIWASIMLPLSKPALMVVALFTFIGTWNDFLSPLIYLMDDSKYTLSIGLTMFQGQYGSEWGPMMAMSLLMTLPVIALFFFTQKTFIQGVKLGGVKG